MICLFIQVFFFLFVFSKLIWYKEKKEKQVPFGISIVLAAHNELFNLQNLIPQLLRQQYAHFEIVLVNDRSTDGTAEFLRENYGMLPNIKIIHVEDVSPTINPKKHALTLGIQLADYETIVLTDADCLPRSKQWIQEIAESFLPDTEIVLGYAPYFPKPGLLNRFIRFETFYTAVQYFGFALSGMPYMGVGRNLAYRKSLFTSNKGFKPHEILTGGDDDLFVQKVIRKGNFNLVFNEKSQTVSVPKHSLKDYYKQKKRHLKTGEYYKLKYKILLGLLTISHLLFFSTFIILLFSLKFLPLVLMGFIFRTLTIIVIFSGISKRLREKFNWISLPLLDIMYIINYLLVGITTVFSRRISWK